MDGEERTVEEVAMPPESVAYQLAQMAFERDRALAEAASMRAASSESAAKAARDALEKALTDGGAYEVAQPVDLTAKTYKRRRV